MAIYVNEFLTNLTSAREHLTNRAELWLEIVTVNDLNEPRMLASPKLWPPGAASSFLRPRTCRSQGAARPRPISPPPAAWTRAARSGGRSKGGRRRGPGRRQRRGSRILRAPWRRARRGEGGDPKGERGEGRSREGGEGRSRGAREGRSREREEHILYFLDEGSFLGYTP